MSIPTNPNNYQGKSYGSSGKGLRTNSAYNKFGKSAEAGASGEDYFRSLMNRSGITNRYNTFYSLGIPNDPTNHNATNYTGDVDVAILNADKILLIDVKRWSAGYHYWSLFGKPMKNLQPLMHNGKWELSKNMAAAVSRYNKAVPGVQVLGLVVFVPTGKNGTLPASVGMLKWTGGIKSVTSQGALNKIPALLGLPSEPNQRALQVVGSMVK